MVPFKREFRIKREHPLKKRPTVVEAEGGVHYIQVSFEPAGGGRFGEFAVCLLLDFGPHGATMIELKVDVADPDLEAAIQLDSDQQQTQVWDCIERRTIPAFPGSRPNASHLKTADDVAWHPE
eukprot:2709773-Prymnesium_polylepis.1